MKKIIAILSASLLLSACMHNSTTQQASLDLTGNNNQQLSSDSMTESNKPTPKTAVIKTSMGDITVKLFADQAPITVNNFADLAEGDKTWTNPQTNKKTNDPLYNNTIFHRVIDGFMIQGGDPLGNGTGGPGYRFQDEVVSSLTFDKPYLLAMANSGPNTNGSQFFITVAATPWLNGKHTIFGEVTSGQEVVDKIATSPTGANDKPVTDITIKQITITR